MFFLNKKQSIRRSCKKLHVCVFKRYCPSFLQTQKEQIHVTIKVPNNNKITLLYLKPEIRKNQSPITMNNTYFNHFITGACFQRTLKSKCVLLWIGEN